MSRKIILKQNGLSTQGNTPTGYKYIGDDSGVISEKLGSTVSAIGGGGNTTYNNGITSSGGVVGLGGSFSNTISIGTDDAGNYGFNIKAGSSIDYGDGWYNSLNLEDTGRAIMKSYDGFTDKKSELYLSTEETYGSIEVSDTTGNSGNYYKTVLSVEQNSIKMNNIFSNPDALSDNGNAEFNISTTGILLTDGRTGSLTPVGMEYAADYSANYTNRSLVDKGYVDGVFNATRRYKALLTQTGTNAPTATVLENTLGGTPIWSRQGAGQYLLTLASAFGITKTLVTVMSVSEGGFGSSAMYEGGKYGTSDNNVVCIYTTSDDNGTSKLDFADDLLYNSTIIIEVYD